MKVERLNRTPMVVPGVFIPQMKSLPVAWQWLRNTSYRPRFALPKPWNEQITMEKRWLVINLFLVGACCMTARWDIHWMYDVRTRHIAGWIGAVIILSTCWCLNRKRFLLECMHYSLPFLYRICWLILECKKRSPVNNLNIHACACLTTAHSMMNLSLRLLIDQVGVCQEIWQGWRWQRHSPCAQNAKFHAELAGEGVRYSWADAKAFYRRLPARDSIKQLIMDCICPTNVLTKQRIQKFASRARTYTCTYHHIEQKNTENAAGSVAADDENQTASNTASHAATSAATSEAGIVVLWDW